MNSRSKGKRGELEAAALLREYGYEARRGQQFQGGPGSPDVVHSMSGFHIEVKRVENLALYPAMEQAARDAGAGETPVVLHRRNGKEWVAILDARAFLGLVSGAGPQAGLVHARDQAAGAGMASKGPSA